MQFQIREATVEDAKSLSGLLIEVHDAHVDALPHVFRRIEADDQTEGFLRGQIASEDGQAFVAESAGQLAGYLWIRLHEAPPIHLFIPRRYAEIDTLVVSAPFRRRGIGQALVRRAHRWAAEQGADQVQLVVYEFNQEAIRFYERLGYGTTRRTMWRSLQTGADTS